MAFVLPDVKVSSILPNPGAHSVLTVRLDNHMINGTKLLNVAGMTRGRRDGILKSEKTRHVVKIGPMHLKGVWIPFDRALDFANKEKITESLYPLFVHNIGALLYHPQNSARQSISGAAIAGAERRRADGQPDYMRTSQSSQTPSLQHHHTMSNSIGAHIPQPPHSIVGHSAAGRPGLDRAHTFPTPPTSASSVMGMGNSGSSYDWPGAHVSGTVQTTQPLTIDTGLSNARSVPTTPATTPPGNNIQNMQNFQTSQPYDNSRQMYTTSGQQSQYGSQPGMTRYATMPAGGYVKSDMAPPARAGAEQEHNGDAKPHDGYANHSQEHHSDAEAEHEGEYTHTAAPYGTNRNTYGYSSNTASSMQGDHGHISPEMTGSPHKTSGRATPRTTQSYPGYSTPQRAQLPSSNLYSVMSDNRNATNGADMYANHGYPTQQYAGTNGIASNKRVRELDDSEEQYVLFPSAKLRELTLTS